MEIMKLNYSLGPTDRILQPTATEHPFFSSITEYSPGYTMLYHKTGLNKFNKIQILSSTFSDPMV